VLRRRLEIELPVLRVLVEEYLSVKYETACLKRT
jgi:hypothetical protein